MGTFFAFIMGLFLIEQGDDSKVVTISVEEISAQKQDHLNYLCEYEPVQCVSPHGGCFIETEERFIARQAEWKETCKSVAQR